jgi:acyl-CoA dehydrogenase
MNDIIWICTLALLFAICAYHRLSILKTSAVTAVLLIFGTITGHFSFLSWCVFVIVFGVLGNVNLRQRYLSKRLLAFYKRISPAMSTTEQEAIDAGTVWWDGQLFSGQPDWHKLHSVKKPILTNEEQAFLDGPVETVCLMVDEWQINHVDADLSPAIWQYLKDNKFFAMIIKKEYGGLAFSAYAQSRILQKLSGVSAVLSTTVGVPNSLGPGELLQHYGTPEQQQYYLPRLAQGLDIPCFALTSPEAGSDAGAITDMGIICKGLWKGQEVIGIKLTFDKRYITLAPVATVIGLAFKLHDPEQLLFNKTDIGITCALLPRETEGLESGNRHFPLNVPFQNGPIRGQDIFVPLDYIIGGADMAGKGWRMLMECLSVGRCITLPSGSAGGSKSVALATGAYARIRRQFKMPIGKMEGIEEMLARIGGSTYMMDAVTSLSTTAVDLGQKPSVISAICKYHLTERMRVVVNDAMDIHGGKGIMLGPNNYLGRGYQGIPIAITVEGANILTRNMMIFGQGAMRCHPFVLDEIKAAALTDEKAALTAFDSAVFGHIGFALSNFVKSSWFTLTAGYLSASPFNDSTKHYYQLLNGYSANLAYLTDVSMSVLGGSLKRRERLSARLGDILSHLYLTSAVLKRFNDDGRLLEHEALMHWAMQDGIYHIEVAIDEFIRNFPVTAVQIMLRIVVQPLGRTRQRPNDQTEHTIAQMLQTPCHARTLLGAGQFTRPVKGNLLGELEATLSDIVAAEPIFDRICNYYQEKHHFTQLDRLAKRAHKDNVITESEAELMIRAEKGRLKTINVDDFAPEELVFEKSIS